MQKKLKIATIGGGSSYTPEIIEGFIKRASELNIREIVLVDIEEGKEKLEIVGNLARRMVKKAGLDWKVTLTLDRREALKDADFVTTQLRVGLLEARIKDERIPLSLGMIGQETNGVGGMAKALRTIPVILDICKEIEELCPDAWLINFTNPSGMVTEAVLNNTKVKCIGLCNVPVGMKKAVAEILESDDFIFHAVGLNHYVWGKHIYFKGKDVIKDILPKLLLSEKFNPKNIDSTPWVEEQIKETMMMPCPYHKYYYLKEDMLKKQLKDYENHKTRAEFVKEVEDKLFLIYKDENLNEKPKELESRGGAYYSEAACELISSIHNNKKSLMVVNIHNNGIIKSISNDSVIETTAYITSSGAIPLGGTQLSLSASTEVALLKTFEKLVIDAAINCDYGKALQALTINPLVNSSRLAKKALDLVIEQNKKYLKGW
ncbi:MAG: 6-phospho-beta-glucosidase [Fusobacteriaceae bacterium]